MRAWATAVSLAVAVVVPAHASTILGHGAASCGAWTADELDQGVTWVGDKAWLAGYLSAYSTYRRPTEADVPADLDSDARNAWVSAYCAAHPLDRIHEAADALINELKRRAGSR